MNAQLVAAAEKHTQFARRLAAAIPSSEFQSDSNVRTYSEG